MALCKEIGHRQAEAIGHHNCGVRFALLGCANEALDSFEAAVRVAREIDFPLVEAATPLFVGRVLEARGNAEQAEAQYRLSMARLEALSVRDEHAAGAYLSLGALLARTGREAESRVALERGLEIAEECGVPGARALAHAELARLHVIGADRAMDVLREAQGRMDLESKTHTWFCLWRATEDPAHLEEAKRLLDHALSLASEEHRRSMLENVPPAREIMEAWNARGAEGGDA